MNKNWREYNEELVKRGEILIDPSNSSPVIRFLETEGTQLQNTPLQIHHLQVIIFDSTGVKKKAVEYGKMNTLLMVEFRKNRGYSSQGKLINFLDRADSFKMFLPHT